MTSAKEITRWFITHIKDGQHPYSLDKYQAAIIADNHKNTLVTARAGSGKTRTIVAKIVYLLCHEGIKPEEIIVFAFNRKAKTEINQRLTQITCDDRPLFNEPPGLATTFHAFAYNLLGGKSVIGQKIIDESTENRILSQIVTPVLQAARSFNAPSSSPRTKTRAASSSPPQVSVSAKPPSPSSADVFAAITNAKQFITRAEQQFSDNYPLLHEKILSEKSPTNRTELLALEQIMTSYHRALARVDLLNFNQLVARAAKIVKNLSTPYRYLFVDEYQDFSLLFLHLITSLRQSCPNAHLLAVGDDWQAINRFAGSDVEYFLNFKRYFPEDAATLFIPTNYRSGKSIVKNANYFMSRALGDYKGCKSGGKLKAKIYFCDTSSSQLTSPRQDQPALLLQNQSVSPHSNQSHLTPPHVATTPLLLEKYARVILSIIRDNPKKDILLLHRNNNFSLKGYSVEDFTKILRQLAVKKHLLTPDEAENRLSCLTIHRSKGLEADVVVLLEIDAEKFPSKDKTGGLYHIFGETEKTLFEDESRLFYVALTRPKEKLYILSKTIKITSQTKKLNFFNYLDDNFLNEYLPT